MKLYLQWLAVSVIAIAILDSCGVNTRQITLGNNASCTVTYKSARYECVASSKTGRIWLDRNIGASQVASTAFTYKAYGNYFQWGRPADGHQRSNSPEIGSVQVSTTSPSSNSGFITVDTNTSDWVKSGVDDNGTQREAFLQKTDGTGICPQGYRVPTIAEWRAELNASSQDMSSSVLNLPLAGFRDGITGEVKNAVRRKNDPNAVGYYLASDSSSQKRAKFLFLDQNRRGKIETKGRAYGYSVRCIKAQSGEKAPAVSGGESGKTPSGGSSNASSGDDHKNSMVGATPINLTSTTSGDIEVAGDVDWFKVVIPSTGRLVVETTGSIDAEGTLYDASGRHQIAYDDDGGTDHNFKIMQTVTAGTYYVEVRHRASGTGIYALSASFTASTPVSDDYGNTKNTAATIGTTSTTSGEIETAGDEDWFKVVIPSAGTLVVNTTGSTDTYGYLLDANNREIESNDDGGLDRNFKISKFITTAGTYYVRVKHHSTSLTGSYSLVSQFIADDYGNARNTAATISATSTTSGNLEIVGDVDYFKIVIPSSATRKGALTVDINDTRTYTFLRDTADRQLASFHGLEGNVMRPVRAGETYYVSVEGSSAAPTVRYTLTSQFTPDDHGDTKETATLINPDSNTSGHITSYEDKDYFKIVIPRAGTLVVETTGATDTKGTLSNNNGRGINYDSDSG
ncbi:MAG: pre-peptidase C-terminal domain-containing protein, partial [Sulfurovum sp.]|nr:pre-peptidase C-terminal domain-containing protein [Sulfurovum sp.]